ncbi:protein hunchback [Rhagoletis pomonella]|uniref:protein hunchback n=1 Tax=Rhagoletis pomonella TaxID=28610 RepID=UPI00178167C6|nr:protein hunchback [Rhagoletis pomonella]
MQNWDAVQTASVNYEQHSIWYNNMFSTTNIKTEPGVKSPSLEEQPRSPTSGVDVISHLESYLKQQPSHTPRQISAMDTLSTMTPSPSNTDSMHHLYDGNIQQQLLQQQQYQEQFQQAQQSAAHNHVTSSHLQLGFNPLTPPGLPNAILPSLSRFYHQPSMPNGQQTPSPQPPQTQMVIPMESIEKQQTALTPRNTPPMDITPPKSPKTQATAGSEKLTVREKDQDAQSNSSEDIKYIQESEDDELIRLPIYNSHGKMKNYKCKSCGMIAITKVSFWEHARTHMKPEKILQCPKCPFVTELKHHLEYHIRKHKNLKPFQCDKCSYTCVNKSMLNSHRKSHSTVYQYRCADCDYATKYCHSFKLHLRKYDHKPGLVLDEEGIPNPSVVIDVYGTRRGPKSKSSGTNNKRNNSTNSSNASNERLTVKSAHIKNGRDFKLSASQLSVALQSFSLPLQNHQMPVSPAKSPSSVASDQPMLPIGLSQLHNQQLPQMSQQAQSTYQERQTMNQGQPNGNVKVSPANSTITDAKAAISSLLPPLASILQKNPNMAFLPYWNLNLQMLAAQQQAAVLAQMSPSVGENALRQFQSPHLKKDDNDSSHSDDNEDDDYELDRKSTDSAMDLSQGSPVKDDLEHRKTPALPANLGLKEKTTDTPIASNNGASKRKGRVLKLDAILQVKSASQSAEDLEEKSESVEKSAEHISAAASPNNTIADNSVGQTDENSDDCDDLVNNMKPTVKDTSTSSASSSGNSSNSSSSSSSLVSASNGPAAFGAMYECKYCDIYFKDAVLYTIHMGYHSCDDVFKCNMCGEKCDGPVGLFVHMARNAHS